MSATLAAAKTSERASPGARVPAVRVRPVPRSEPPSDDERRAAGVQAPPMAAPVLPLRMPAQRRRRSPRRASATRPVAEAPAPVVQPEPDSQPPAVSPARLATRRFLAICIEVLGGFRPITQLRALCLPERFDEIAKGLRAHTPGVVPGSRPPGTSPAARPAGSPAGRPPVGSPVPRRAPTGAPPRPGRAGQSGAERVTVRRVQVCEPIEGVAEVAAVLARRDHVWAIAVRLERRQERWFCAHLEVI
jgi:hypothetical protein